MDFVNITKPAFRVSLNQQGGKNLGQPISVVKDNKQLIRRRKKNLTTILKRGVFGFGTNCRTVWLYRLLFFFFFCTAA